MISKAIKMSELNNMQGAIDYLEGVLSNYPDFADAHYSVAIYYRAYEMIKYGLFYNHDAPSSLGAYAKSAEHNERAVAIRPFYPEAYINLGFVLLNSQ